MRVVGIGDIVVDYYYKDDKLLGISGGMTTHNIIVNLAKKDVKTAIFSVCGNDSQGRFAIKELENLKVDISNIEISESIRTRCFHISYYGEGDNLSFKSKKRCPVCNIKKWYDESAINVNKILKSLKKDDILVFDNLNSKNQKIIDKSDNIKMLDLGQYFEFENIDNETIIEKISNKFEIININERVSKYLMKRFEIDDELSLFRLLKTRLVTITKGEKGASFVCDKGVFDYKLGEITKPIDPTGAGDAFFSSIIFDYIKNNCVICSSLFEKWYENTLKITKKVVTKMGARGHIVKLTKIKSDDETCTCDTFTIFERKKIKRCNLNINNLEARVINAINSPAYKNIADLNFNNLNNTLFIGTGGSFAGASFASNVINEIYGSNSFSLLPRDVAYRNNKEVDGVFLFSYSGTTNDIIQSVEKIDNNKKIIITKGEIQDIVTKTGISKKKIISYRTASNKGKERGFLSFEGALSPAAIFFKYYVIKKSLNIDVDNFVRDSIKNWHEKLSVIITKDLTNKILNKGIINIFRGDYTNPAACDLESKIIESGIFNCIIHEKKNFSHGRFINYENLNNNISIYFKQNVIDKYEKNLIKYLSDNCVIIESKYNGLLASFDLLIASQLIMYYIGKNLNIDISKPKYSDDAMKIYFYKGSI